MGAMGHYQDGAFRSGRFKRYSSASTTCQALTSINNKVDIRGIYFSVRPFNRCTGKVAIRPEFHVFVDIGRTKWREKRGEAFRKTLLVDRVVRRQADVEHKVETSRIRDDPYITNRDALTSIYVWEGTAGLGEPYR